MKPVLLADFGSTYTKVTAVDVDAGRILDTARAYTTVSTDIAEGFRTAADALEYRLGKTEFSATYACSSAAGGLRMVAVGLVPDFTVEAARRAALSAGAKVIKVYSYDLDSESAAEIGKLQPDIVLLTGGTDGGDTGTILHNARMIAALPGNFPVIVAGNKAASGEAGAVLSLAGKEVSVCENVLPNFDDINIAPAREQIKAVFLRRIVHAKGLSHVQQIIDGILMPTPSAVLEALQALSVGAGSELGVGALMAVDVGGATTDVYSICDGAPSRPGVLMKGLPEPYAKRTVEGDIGVRASALSLMDAAGADAVAGASGMSKPDVAKCMGVIAEAPEILPTDREDVRMLDRGMALLAVRLSVQRHAGFYEFNYTKSGETFLQTGKDLTRISRVIGTGGPVIGAEKPAELLADALGGIRGDMNLTPRDAACFIDGRYILAAMGLLAGRYPEMAVRILKRELGL